MNAIIIEIGKLFKSRKTGKLVKISAMQISIEENGKMDGWVDFEYTDGQFNDLVQTANRDIKDFTDNYEAI